LHAIGARRNAQLPLLSSRCAQSKREREILAEASCVATRTAPGEEEEEAEEEIEKQPAKTKNRNADSTRCRRSVEAFFSNAR